MTEPTRAAAKAAKAAEAEAEAANEVAVEAPEVPETSVKEAEAASLPTTATLNWLIPYQDMVESVIDARFAALEAHKAQA